MPFDDLEYSGLGEPHPEADLPGGVVSCLAERAPGPEGVPDPLIARAVTFHRPDSKRSGGAPSSERVSIPIAI